MRKKLAEKNGERLMFTGTVERFGTAKNWHGYPERTILVKDIVFTDSENFATDHLWFKVGKIISRMNLKEGDKIQFEARVSRYIKGYVNWREYIDERQMDYKLNRPTKFKKL